MCLPCFLYDAELPTTLSDPDDTTGDEKRPICTKCERSGEECEWDAFIKFRPPTGLAESRDSTPSGPIILRIQSDSEVCGPDLYRVTLVCVPSL